MLARDELKVAEKTRAMRSINPSFSGINPSVRGNLGGMPLFVGGISVPTRRFPCFPTMKERYSRCGRIPELGENTLFFGGNCQFPPVFIV